MNIVGKIHPVVANGDELFKDPIGDLVYAYVPTEFESEFVRTIPTPYKKLKVVDLKFAETFYKPTRKGGTDDKFIQVKKGEWYDDFN